MSKRQRILLETTAARDNAEAMLRSLLDSKARQERALAELKQTDAFKAATGRTAMDNAIASTQRIVETYNRVIAQLKKDLSEEDLAMLEEAEQDGTP